MSVPAALETIGLGRRYRTRWALRDCTVTIPAGSVTALVGPNGAGKTTLLHLAVGLLRPTVGTVSVLGSSPDRDASSVLPRIGFVAQDHPLYRGFTLADLLRFGRRLNRRWDDDLARARLERLGLSLGQRAGTLSGGQQAQVALTLALAKQPELLVLDEPVASLDPLARREFLQALMEAVADGGLTVLLSSHIVADLERVSDHLVILAGGSVRVSESIEHVIRHHRVLVGPRADAAAVSRVHDVISARHTERQSTLLVRVNGHVYDTCWQVNEVDLEEIVLAYLATGAADGRALEQPREAVAR